MLRALLILLLTCCARLVIAEDTSTIQFPSPNRRFALRVADFTDAQRRLYVADKVDLIETPSDKVILDLGTLWINRDDETDREKPVLVWSADSKWVAYGRHTSHSGSTTVYHWNGASFDEVTLPADLPEPKLDSEKVKPKGYAVRPLRWVKPGELELSNELKGLMRDEPGYCTARQLIIVGLTAPTPTVKKVGKTEMTISK